VLKGGADFGEVLVVVSTALCLEDVTPVKRARLFGEVAVGVCLHVDRVP